MSALESTAAPLGASPAFTREPPGDIELEQALLGALMLRNDAFERVNGLLRDKHFLEPIHGRIYAAIGALVNEGRLASPHTLRARLAGEPAFAELGGLDYLSELVKRTPSTSNVPEMARVLLDFALRRDLIAIGTDVVETAYTEAADPSPHQQIERAESALYAAAQGIQYNQNVKNFAQSLKLAMQLAEQAVKRRGDTSGVATGFKLLDWMLGGLQASDLIILAGRPGMGKTALAVNMAYHAAHLWRLAADAGVPPEDRSGAPVAFFSLEMSAAQLATRILSEQTSIPAEDIRRGKIADVFERLVHAQVQLEKLPFYIDDTAGISVPQMLARARRIKREHGHLGMVVVDYLQLLTAGSHKRYDNRVQELTEITKGLKLMAKELNVPVLALSQLNRGVDSRDDKRPILSDLRESGSIEQDADVVMFVYREEYYLKTRKPDEDSPDYAKWRQRLDKVQGTAELLVEKHRHGPTGSIDLLFEGAFARFSNPASDEYEQGR